MTMTNKLSQLGAQARREQGLASAKRVYDFIKVNPGCSVYRIARGLELEVGTAGTIVERLERAGEIKRKKGSIEKGRFKWEIYAAGQPLLHRNVVKYARQLKGELAKVLENKDLLEAEECKVLDELDTTMKNFWYNNRRPDKE